MTFLNSDEKDFTQRHRDHREKFKKGFFFAALRENHSSARYRADPGAKRRQQPFKVFTQSRKAAKPQRRS
jgi:hypothetical protein